MDKKKILIVTHGFYPEQSPRSFRATELAKEFYRQGHDVKVIAPHRQGIESFFRKYPISFRDLGQVNWRVPHLSGQSKWVNFANRGIRRLLNLLLEYPNIQLLWKVRKALKGEDGHDLLISIAVPYPIHWGVASAWRLNSPIATTWVADCGDPYMGQENDSFRPPFYFGWLEKWFCKKTDYLSVPTEGAFQGYYPEFRHKIKVIPQGFKFEEYQFNISSASPEKVIFGYGGMFIPNYRDPKEFLIYLQELEKKGFQCFEFHIYTKTPQHVLKYVNNSKSIKVHAPIERKDLMKHFASMDFLVNFSNTGDAQTPSKLIDYAILKKPVLRVDSNNSNPDIVLEFLQKNYTRGFQVKNPDQYRIERVVRSFLNLSSPS